MKFCEVCDNMYYICISDIDNKLSYSCRNCGNKDTAVIAEGVCVLERQIDQHQQKFTHIINEYTKLDPTLPRINNIPCPNQECSTNLASDQATPREIIYIRYDDVNLKYVYICTTCDTNWKT